MLSLVQNEIPSLVRHLLRRVEESQLLDPTGDVAVFHCL